MQRNFQYQELWDLIYFSAKLTSVLLSIRLYVMIPAIAPARLCKPGPSQSFVPSWKRLQSSKQRGTIFSPGKRAPSSHKAKQNYAMRQDNVLGMWSLAACSQHSHSSTQPWCRRAAQNGGRLHPSAGRAPQPRRRTHSKEPSPPHPSSSTSASGKLLVAPRENPCPGQMLAKMIHEISLRKKAISL